MYTVIFHKEGVIYCFNMRKEPSYNLMRMLEVVWETDDNIKSLKDRFGLFSKGTQIVDEDHIWTIINK